LEQWANQIVDRLLGRGGGGGLVALGGFDGDGCDAERLGRLLLLRARRLRLQVDLVANGEELTQQGVQVDRLLSVRRAGVSWFRGEPFEPTAEVGEHAFDRR